MKAKLYINSEESTIEVEGDSSGVLHLLVCFALKSKGKAKYF